MSLTSVIVTVDLYLFIYIFTKYFFFSFFFFHNYKPVSACRIVYVSNIQQRLSEPPSFRNVTDPELSTNPVVNCTMQVFFLHTRSVKCDPCGDLAECGGNWTTGLSIIQMGSRIKKRPAYIFTGHQLWLTRWALLCNNSPERFVSDSLHPLTESSKTAVFEVVFTTL